MDKIILEESVKFKCTEEDRNKRYFYALAEKYGFLAPKEYSTRIPSVEKIEN